MSYFVQMLKENEQLVCDLYELFAKKFPEYKVFWESISKDEKKHVDFLSKINMTGQEFNEKVIHQKSVQSMIDHLQTTITKVKLSRDYTMKQAVAEALNIENSMVELKFFEPFRSKGNETSDSIKVIEKDTKNHYQKLKDMNAHLN